MPDRTLPELLAAVRHACQSVGVTALDPQLAALEASLSGGGVIEVAVLGQFKAGKSSFLNSIIGHDILPVGVVPVTAVVTKVRHGVAIEAMVEKVSGERMAVPVDRLAAYVSERGNPGNAKQIRLVEVIVPLPEGMRELVFVDTPGLGSVHGNNSEETRRFLPNAGYGIYLVSAERPLGAVDRELIADASRYCGGVAVVMTKSDLATPQQESELVAYIEEQLARMPERPPLFRYSIRKGTDEYRAAIRERFLGPLTDHYGAALEKAQRRKGETLAAACLDYLAIVLRVAEERQEKREMLAQAVAAEIGTLGMTRQELQILMTGCVGGTRAAVEERLQRHRAEMVVALFRSFDEESALWEGNLYRLTRSFAYWLREELGREVAAAVSAEHESLKRPTADAARHFLRYARGFRDRLDKSLLDSLGVVLPPHAFALDDDRPVRPDIRISRVFDTPVELLWFLFPMSLFRRFFLRFYRAQIPDEVGKNLHRTVSDITEIVNRRIADFSAQTYAFIVRESETLKRLLDREPAAAEAIREEIEALRNASKI